MTYSQSNKQNWPKFTIFLEMKKHMLSTVAFVHKWWNQKLIKSHAWNLNKCVHVEKLWFTALWKAEIKIFLTSHRFESKAFKDRKGKKVINLLVDLVFKLYSVEMYWWISMLPMQLVHLLIKSLYLFYR